MFFENPVKLPFFNVELPLIGFFVLGPLLFLIVHTYTLLHFVMLAGKVGAFDAELQAQVDDIETRARLRRQLPSNIFVQFLAGPRDVRGGTMGFLLRLIAWISLVIGPICLLMFFQLQFLPLSRGSNLLVAARRRGYRSGHAVGLVAVDRTPQCDGESAPLARLPARPDCGLDGPQPNARAAGVHSRDLSG